MGRRDFDVLSAAGEISAVLSALGCTFEVEADNRHGKRASRYLCVRKPFAAKVRVADHRSNWIERNAARSRFLMLDVGPHAMTVAEAIERLSNNVRLKAACGSDETGGGKP